MSFGHAIYYPHINLTNKNWLKYAILFWDKISRIVPESVHPSDSEDVIRIRSELEFIEDYHPERWDTSDAANRFFHSFRIWINDPELVDHYRHLHPLIYAEMRHRRHGSRHPEMFEFLGEVAKEQGTYIHVQKLHPELKKYLYMTGVAVPGENEWSDWVKIDNELGLLYMTYLAASIGQKTYRPTVTDYSTCFAASSVFIDEIARPSTDEVELTLGNLLIASYGPKDLNSVTIDQLINFRQKYDKERMAYFNAISDICINLSSIDNKEAMKDALSHHGKVLKSQTEDLRKQFLDIRIEPIFRFVGITIPSICTTAIELIPEAIDPVLIAGGALLGFASAAHSHMKNRKALQRNPMSYLLSLQSELNAKNIFKGISDNIQGITKSR